MVNHDISVKDITAMFESSHSFFELPDKVKENYPMDYPRNAGWEKLSQVKKEEKKTCHFTMITHRHKYKHTLDRFAHPLV